MRSLLRVRAARLPAVALAAARAIPAATSRLARPGTRALSDVATEMDGGEAEEAMQLSSPVLSRAIQLLLAQETQGVAADASQDGLMQSVLLNPRLSDAILAYFTAHKDMAMRAGTDVPGRMVALGDAYASLIYACVKMRKLNLAFDHHDDMRAAGVPVDARVYASLLKGCGRTKKVKRGEGFFRSLLARNEKSARDVTVYNALLNMYSHQLPRSQLLGPQHVADSWRVFNDMVAQGIMPNEVHAPTAGIPPVLRRPVNPPTLLRRAPPLLAGGLLGAPSHSPPLRPLC
jgi:pentatricopeptide repeat protein